MKVFVIMGNDYPDCVFKSERKAESFVEKKRKEQGDHPRIYWRVYGFELQE